MQPPEDDFEDQMPVNADELIDRRRLRRKLTFWRVVSLAVAAVAILVSSIWALGGSGGTGAANHIAKVRIDGAITEDEELIERLNDIRQSKSVQGVILAVDSPGGTTAGGEAIFEEVRRLAAEKPVVAQVGTLAASAGYMIASAADHIVARKSSIVGSIGVLVQYPDVTGLMDKLGIKLEEVKSSPLKAEPNPFNPTTDEERAALRAMIMDSYDWFVGLVDERRPLTRAEATALADGKVYTGRQALERKLVDSLGGEREAIAWLKGKGVDDTLEVVEWKKQEGGFASLLGSRAENVDLANYGLEQMRELIKAIGGERLFLDGLVSLWQPK